MKLTLFQLEEARRNPRAYGEKLALAAEENEKSKFNSRNFRTYLRSALRDYHTTHRAWPDIADDFLKVSQAKLSHLQYAPQRISQYGQTLNAYFRGFPKQGVTFIELEKRFSLPVGTHVITGKIDRFDLRRPRGYRATDIQITKANWRKKLRWPLIQHGLALEMGGSAAEVEVGVHCFETGVVDYNIFEHAEIEAALAEAEEICDEVAGYGGERAIDSLP